MSPAPSKSLLSSSKTNDQKDDENEHQQNKHDEQKNLLKKRSITSGITNGEGIIRQENQ